MFSDKDITQITRRGSDQSVVEAQIQYFINGFPFLNLARPATVGDGIIHLTDEMIKKAVHDFDVNASEGSLALMKFVPASGAASRMFKSLYNFLEEGTTDEPVDEFFKRLKDFAFYHQLKEALASDDLDIESVDKQTIVEYFLTEKGLGYGLLPKGLLEFHRYDEAPPRTSMEEHMIEGVQYANSGGSIRLHFTVSPEHRDKFEKLVVERIPPFENKFGVKLYVTFSEQDPATDTIAVDTKNDPFREKDGSLLFRPAGHGALLENLKHLDADLVFIKNIDNVVPDRLKETTTIYKKALAGLLLDLQHRIFIYLEKLNHAHSVELITEIDRFFREILCVEPPKGFEGWNDDEKANFFKEKLNRPIRVCGMVKNEGEAGGGPFWVENTDGTTSLQIVESAQANLEDSGQNRLWQKATHFNPVDLICATKDWNGEPFALADYMDPNTGFITAKSKDGKKLKAQELPGLWNGSMANWNTFFVEVPLITFNPVKTINDLLREQHR